MKNRFFLFVSLLLLVGTAAACGGADNTGTDNTVSLAVTQTLEAIAQQQQNQPTPTLPENTATPVPEGLPADYPAREVCEEMAGIAAEYLGVPASIALSTFDQPSGLGGEGCIAQAVTDGTIADTWGDATTALMNQIEANGWKSDFYWLASGVGGFSETYRRDGMVCQVVISAGPTSRELCNEDEPIWDCMERLPPEDEKYMVEISCSEDQSTNLSGMGSYFTLEEVRIQFNEGETSQVLPGDLSSQGVDRFVLQASEGQTLKLNLTTAPVASAVLSVWGADGELYLSGIDMRNMFNLVLPKTQDYYVDIKNVTDGDIIYQLIVDIPPAN